jgi:hypothetical protein
MLTYLGRGGEGGRRRKGDKIETFAPVCHRPEISLDLRCSLLGRGVDVLVEYALVLTFMCCAEMLATAQKKIEIWMCKIWMCRMEYTLLRRVVLNRCSLFQIRSVSNNTFPTN